MLDIKLIREQPEFVKAELAKVGFPGQELDELLELDRRRRALIHETEPLKARRSARSQEIRRLTDPQERAQEISKTRELGEQVGQLETAVNALEEASQR